MKAGKKFRDFVCAWTIVDLFLYLFGIVVQKFMIHREQMCCCSVGEYQPDHVLAAAILTYFIHPASTYSPVSDNRGSPT